MTKKTELNFEKSLHELEQLVEKMEEGDISLEESLKYFERGIALTRSCQKALSEAEQKIRILLDKTEGAELDEFEPDNDSA